jgi:hypothetical protein
MSKGPVMIALAIAATGCRGAGPVEPQPVEDPEVQELMTKLEPYLRCLDHAGHVFAIGDAYRRRYEATAPTARDMRVTIAADPQHCIEGTRVAKDLEPALPELESAGEAYAHAIRAVFELTSDVHAYVTRTSKKYDPEKGLALHPDLLGSFRRFEVAQARLFDQVYLVNRRAHDKQLASRQEKHGRTLAVITEDAMLRAEGLVQFASVPWSQLDQIDLVAAAAQLDSYAAALHEATRYARTRPEEARTMIAADDGYASLLELARAYLVAAEQMLDRARNKVPYTDAERLMITSSTSNAGKVIGTPAAMIDAYNRLIDAYDPLQAN